MQGRTIQLTGAVPCAKLQEPDNPHYVPRVSPYRLAGHLTSAFAIYATLVWTTASLFQPAPLAAAAGAAAQQGAALLRWEGEGG